MAALKHLSFTGKKVVSILSGNMDYHHVFRHSARPHPARPRVHGFDASARSSQGEPVRAAQTIASMNGNVICLDHNQFVNTNRNEGVELRVTIEAYGTDHKTKSSHLKPLASAPAYSGTCKRHGTPRVCAL